jgi:hypothetical protein
LVIGMYFLLFSVLTSVATMYQGYQLVLTGSPRAARERLVPLSGTAVSVSPLQMKEKKTSCTLISCIQKLARNSTLKKLKGL